MKINIVTVSNSSYFPFLKIWLKSLHEVVNLENVESIYVINTGLEESEREFINSFPTVRVVETGIDSVFTSLHGEGWQQSNYSKLPVIKTILELEKIPTYFVDVDCVFVRDFYDLLDFSKDIVVCDTSDRSTAKQSKLIGSFYGFNNVDVAIPFIDKWYDYILNSTKVTTAWRESPSLSLLWEEENDALKFQRILEGVVCASLFSTPKECPYIVHMKSEGGLGFNTPSERMRMPHVAPFIHKYV